MAGPRRAHQTHRRPRRGGRAARRDPTTVAPGSSLAREDLLPSVARSGHAFRQGRAETVGRIGDPASGRTRLQQTAERAGASESAGLRDRTPRPDPGIASTDVARMAQSHTRSGCGPSQLPATLRRSSRSRLVPALDPRRGCGRRTVDDGAGHLGLRSRAVDAVPGCDPVVCRRRVGSQAHRGRSQGRGRRHGRLGRPAA